MNSPLEVRVRKGGNGLSVAFDAAHIFEFSAEFLRVESTSAEVKGHGAGQKKTVGGKKNVKIINLEPVGNYALKIEFDDGHNTGLYSWKYLHQLGENQEEIWQNYLNNLENLGKERWK